MAHVCPLCGGPVPACEAFTDGVNTYFIGGRVIRLTASEYRVFEVLYKRRPAVVHTEALIGMLYDFALDPPDDPDGIIKVHMSKIRRKLGGVARIENIWGTGYRLTHVCPKEEN